MGLRGVLGRLVRAPATDPWSQLVADLRGAYASATMPGYGHQRIHEATAFLSSSGFWDKAGKSPPPLGLELPVGQLVERPPAVPVLTITLAQQRGRSGSAVALTLCRRGKATGANSIRICWIVLRRRRRFGR